MNTNAARFARCFSASLVVSLSALAVSAVDNYWTGAVNGDWDEKKTLNWAVKGTGTACAWTRPSNTYIDTTLFSSNSPMNLAVTTTSLYVYDFFAKIEKDKEVAINLNQYNGTWCDGDRKINWRKTGEGTLTFHTASNNVSAIVIGGNTVEIEEGTLQVATPNGNRSLGELGSEKGRVAADKITEYNIHSNATFIIGARGMCGNANYGSGVRVRVQDGAKFQIGPEYNGYGEINCCTVNQLLLEGGQVSFDWKGNVNLGILGVDSLLKLTGTKPCTLDAGSDGTRAFVLGYGGNEVGNCFQDHEYPVIDVANVTGDEQVDLDIKMPLGRNGNVGGKNLVCFTKTGPGTLRFSWNGNNTMGVNGNINILEGEVQFWNIDTLNQHQSSHVYVSTNTTLTIANIAATGQLNNSADGRSQKTFHIDHGRMLLQPRISNYNNNGDVGYCYLGKELVLENAQVDSYVRSYSAASEYGLQALIVGDLVHAKAVPGEFWSADWTARDPSIQYQTLQVNAPGTVFRVDDTTGDDGIDMKVGFLVSDFCKYQGRIEPSTLIKTGAGTLLLSNRRNRMTSVEVHEGTLLVDNPAATNAAGAYVYANYISSDFDETDRVPVSYLGETTAANGHVLVTTNGTLKIARTGEYRNGSYGYDGGHQVTRPLIVDGGTVDIRGTADNGGSNVQMFGPVTLKNGGRFDYTGQTVNLGPFGFHGTLTIDGTQPVVFPALTANNSRIFLWPDYQTTFEVKDVTGDLETDFTTYLCPGMPGNQDYFDGSAEIRGKGQPGDTWRYGWTKTGEGTMALNFCDPYRFHTLPVVVSNGTLLVNDNFVHEAVLNGKTHTCAGFNVCAGARVGGSGTVASLSLEDGAGFFAAAGQRTSLMCAAPVALPKSGKVVIKAPQGLDVSAVKGARVLTSLAGFTGAENLSDWTVEVPGYETGNFRVFLKGNTLCTSGGSGFSVIIR